MTDLSALALTADSRLLQPYAARAHIPRLVRPFDLQGLIYREGSPWRAEAAKRICEALRAGGIEVWFDQSELRGGGCVGPVYPPADQELCAIYPAIRQLRPREEHKIWLPQPFTPA